MYGRWRKNLRFLTILPVIGMMGHLNAQTATYIGPNTTNNDRWNLTTSWDVGAVPSGAVHVVIPAGAHATAWSDDTPLYSGNLSIGENSTLQMGWLASYPASFNALGTPGETVITMGGGAHIRSRSGNSFNMPEIQLTGDASVQMGSSTQPPSECVFDYPVTGSHGFTIATNSNGGGVHLNAANSFTSLTLNGVSGRGGAMPTIAANVPGALGSGDVTINPDANGGRSPQLRFNVEGAMDITASLNINGEGRTGDGSDKIHLAANAIIRSLQIEGVEQAPGDYTSSNTDWISGPGTLTVLETVAGTTETLINVKSPAADADDVYIADEIRMDFNRIIVANPGDITLRNLTDGTQEVIPTNDPRVTIFQNVLTIENNGLLEWNKQYAIRITSGAVEDADSGTPFAGISDDTTWIFSTLAADPLLVVIASLKDHITGESTLDAAQIEQHKFSIDAEKARFSESAEIITSIFDLVETYDTVIGPLWIARGEFSNRHNQANDLDWTIYHVMQYIMDEIYNPETIAAYEALLDGFKFASSAHFPGACDPPADPEVSHNMLIQGSFEKTFGRNTQQWTLPARKPTGTYLAPGTIATVTVPPELVNQGYQVRVGAHSWDLENRRNQVRRLDRATIAYDITSTTTKVASPYGGGIYIEVPFGADAGVVEVTVTGGARAPFFSARSFHQTTLQEWLDTERHHPAPWADFQSDKYMMQVPTGWVSEHPDPVTMMEDWDKAMDVQNDLMGFPRVRGKETMYCQVDVIMRSTVHAPGYPAINVQYNPFNSTNGYANNYLVRGPAANHAAANIEFHEQGHAYLFPKFGGEMEATVNLAHVAVMQRAFDYDWNTAFRGSLGFNNPNRTLDNTAVTWMTSFNFSPREVAMHTAEKSYQLKGHAKFVEIARLFGWEVLGDYWRSFMEDDANGVSYQTSNDAHLLRLSRNVGYDIRPLFHFWGIVPQNNEALEAVLAVEEIPRSEEIHDLLVHYKSLVPADNAAFRAFGQAWWGKSEPNINGAWTETEHARQWDERIRRSGDGNIRTDITVGEMYVEACAEQVRDRVQYFIDFYFPEALNPDPMGFAIPPTAVDATTIGMEALTASAAVGPIVYYFENTSNSDFRDWDTSPVWHHGGLTTGQTYSYRVKARDGEGNETEWSAEFSASPEEDLTPPTPDPMTFNSPPSAVVLEVCCTSDDGSCGSCLAVTMTATVATDINGVEYYFEAMDGIGSNSGWQDDPTYTDRDLQENTTYTYRVRARDKSPNQNMTEWSEPLSASTGDAPDMDPPEIVSLSPENASSVEQVNTPLVVVFNEPVETGSGHILLKNLTDDTQVGIPVDGPEMFVYGDTLTIQPPTGLELGKLYAVLLDPGLVVDLSGNPFVGITDQQTWSFDTYLENPLADPGGPYTVDFGEFLELDAEASIASGTATITSYEWDLNNDGVFGDVTGVTPSAIGFQELQDVWGMSAGINTIQLRVTDSNGNSGMAETTVAIPVGDATPGFGFFVDAAEADDASEHWHDLVPGNPTGFGLRLDKSEGNEVTRHALTDSVTLLSHAFQFPGGKTGNTGGALLVQSGTTNTRSFQNAGWNTEPVTLEIWFKPDDIDPSTSNGQILFEDGGGTGLGFFINNNEVRFRKQPNNGQAGYNLATDPDELLLGVATEEFIQVLGSYDTVSGEMRLFVNGSLVGTATPGGNNWSGGDAAAFATRGGDNTGGFGSGQSNTESFAGQIALVRAYQGILTEDEAEANFTAVSGIDNKPPLLINLSPANESTDVYPGTVLMASFNENVLLTGEGSVTIRNLDDESGNSDVTITLPDASVTLEGLDLQISPTSNFAFDTRHAIHISGDAVRDVSGNFFGGIDDDTTWTFTTVEQNTNPPVIITRSPAHQAGSVNAGSNIVATFDQILNLGEGVIVIKDLVDDSTTLTISVSDATQVSLAENVLTITPGAFMDIGRSYAVLITAGAVRNFSDVAFAGITSESEWTFTTAQLVSQLGILDLTANDGINPATGVPWEVGDPYRLVFISSNTLNPRDTTSPSVFGSWDAIETWNAEAQNFANNATGHDLSGITWKVLGSTTAVNARDNTQTNPSVHGSGHPIMLIDGSTIIAADFNELWSGEIRNIIDLTENQGQTIGAAPASPWPLTGTNASGTGLGSGGVLRNIASGGNIRQGEASTTLGWIDRANRTVGASTSNPHAIYVISDPLTVQELIVETPYQSWAAANGLDGADAEPGASLQPDGLTNLEKFAFGMDPAVATFHPLEFVVGGEVTVIGSPTLMNFAKPGDPDDERAVFSRIKNHMEAGLVYTVYFSADLKLWTPSEVAPTVLTDDSGTNDLEAVSVSFPNAVPVADSEDPLPAKFMRVTVSME